MRPLPGRAARVALNHTVLAAARDGVRAVVLCPSLIYGAGHRVNGRSIQVPWLIALARKHGVPRHIGRGENLWSNVHIGSGRAVSAGAGQGAARAFYYVRMALLCADGATMCGWRYYVRMARTRWARPARRSAACSLWASAPRR